MEMQHYKRVLDGVEWSVACAALEATKRKSTQVKVKLLKAKSHTAKCEQVRKKMFFFRLIMCQYRQYIGNLYIYLYFSYCYHDYGE